MRPMLDDLELQAVQEVTTYELRALPEHKPPGMSGSILQNLGRRPTRLVVRGVASGPGASDFAGKIEGKFRAAKPVPFTADIVADAKLDLVLIDDLQLTDVAGKPERFAYTLVLREFIKPKTAPDGSALDSSIVDEAKALADGLVGGLAAASAFATGLEPFVGTFTGLLTRLQAFKQALAQH
jgi:hypothetical protein